MRPFLPDFRLVLEDLSTDPLERLRAVGDEPVSDVEEGVQKGLQEGRQDGQQMALATMLLRLATLRFGPVPEETAARIQAAPTPDLERWLEPVLTATRLNDLFQ